MPASSSSFVNAKSIKSSSMTVSFIIESVSGRVSVSVLVGAFVGAFVGALVGAFVEASVVGAWVGTFLVIVGTNFVVETGGSVMVGKNVGTSGMGALGAFVCEVVAVAVAVAVTEADSEGESVTGGA
mmetsp:Transcript_9171/g.10231  ORF Transcript_9171/g.10231 Transcript_9171/m.10231 type:complete len:127 (-) Transcript_9171:45-425(-)